MAQQPLMQAQPGQVIMVQAPMAGMPGQKTNPTYPAIWPEEPVMVTCGHCQAQGMTSVDRTLTDKGWCVCCLMVGACCCCIACCLSGVNNYTHSCSNCRKNLGAKAGGVSVYY